MKVDGAGRLGAGGTFLGAFAPLKNVILGLNFFNFKRAENGNFPPSISG